MARSSAGVARTSGFALALMCAMVVIQLVVAALAVVASVEIADASAFGRSGTVAVVLPTALIACIGAAVAFRGGAGSLRYVLAGLLFVAAGLVGMLVLFFIVPAGPAVGLAILIAPAVLLIALIGQAVLRSAPVRAQGR